jgi:hypothetical protein
MQGRGKWELVHDEAAKGDRKELASRSRQYGGDGLNHDASDLCVLVRQIQQTCQESGGNTSQPQSTWISVSREATAR